MQILKGQPVKRMKPRRLQDKKHLEFVASQPCACCGRMPVQCHHLIGNYGDGGPVRGASLRAGDNFTIALCPTCHRNLHLDGNERRFLTTCGVDGLALAERMWRESHG